MKKYFSDVQELYADLFLNCQSFIFGYSNYGRDKSKPIIEGTSVFRKIELDNECLSFVSNGFGGSSIYINGKIESATKTYESDNCLIEYSLKIDGLDESLTFLACKKR